MFPARNHAEKRAGIFFTDEFLKSALLLQMAIIFWSADMPEKERSEEEARLKEYNGKYQAGLGKIKDARAKFDIK